MNRMTLTFHNKSGMIVYEGRDLIDKIEQDPMLIFYVSNPTIEAQTIAFFSKNTNRDLIDYMTNRPKAWNMEEFFEKNPHLLLAKETGMLDD